VIDAPKDYPVGHGPILDPRFLALLIAALLLGTSIAAVLWTAVAGSTAVFVCGALLGLPASIVAVILFIAGAVVTAFSALVLGPLAGYVLCVLIGLPIGVYMRWHGSITRR
jgi:hypothetical protein